MKGTTTRFTIAFAVPAFAAFAFGVPAFAATAPASTTPATVPAVHATAWAASVREHLGLGDSRPADPVSDTGAQVAPHGVTAWTRSVEAHLASRAHRVAQAGRAALAWSESGMASWYGGRHAGRRTANGDTFNPMQLTCAHPTLPLGTKVLVTSETTGRSVVVTVNDRGPYGGRIVDLSRAAAARIGMLGAGTDNVTLQPASAEAVEVAQAEDSDTSDQAIAAANEGVTPSPHGRRHTRHGAR